jgi:hypothetical protein
MYSNCWQLFCITPPALCFTIRHRFYPNYVKQTIMISIIPNLPAHVLGVRATGEVTKEDVNNTLRPALKTLVAINGGIHYLLVLDTSVKNWDSGAWVSDAMAGVENYTKWHRIAVVSEEGGVQKVTNTFSFALPGESKAFTHDQLDEAIAWVSVHDEKDKV